MNIAVRQYDGNGKLEGVFVLSGTEDLELAFKEEFRRIEMEELIGFADDGPRGGLTWEQVLTKLVETQNMLTVKREGPFKTKLSAPELLAATRDLP